MLSVYKSFFCVTVPVLLPYKPHGSEELFYVPQTEADVSSVAQSDTSMESTHTGTFVSKSSRSDTHAYKSWAKYHKVLSFCLQVRVSYTSEECM